MVKSTKAENKKGNGIKAEHRPDVAKALLAGLILGIYSFMGSITANLIQKDQWVAAVICSVVTLGVGTVVIWCMIKELK